MEDTSNSVMIALLPITTDWCRISLPHLTLVFAGDMDKMNQTDYNALIKDTAALAMLSHPLTLQVFTKEAFGNWSDNPQDAVDVLRLRATSELMAMRNMVEQWNASEFPFNPHVTIGPVGTPLEFMPRSIAFDRIMVGWGNEDVTFWLNRN